MTEEDEAFNEIERRSIAKKEAVRATINKEKPMNNPPAFPTNQYANGISPSGFDTGMTLRDYFAAKAMQGLLAADTNFNSIEFDVAKAAYHQADAMLKAREA
jgi:hypothetical protein